MVILSLTILRLRLLFVFCLPLGVVLENVSTIRGTPVGSHLRLGGRGVPLAVGLRRRQGESASAATAEYL